MVEHIHFIGIGGTGLSAIAKVLLEKGLDVSGSDQKDSPLARMVEQAGGTVTIGHDAVNVAGADMVIVSSAVPENNVEVQAAKKAGIPVLKRSDYLAHLTEGKMVIGVAGTHGKTTTTSMVAWVLTAMQQSPSFIVGGVVSNLETNAVAGEGPIFLIEADEYDYMFLGLKPHIAVVTNVEHDHPDMFPDEESFTQAFRDYVDRLDPDGVLIYCGDDPGAAQLVESSSGPWKTISYGFDGADYDYVSRNVDRNQMGGFTFQVHKKGITQPVIRVNLMIPGLHNVWNALAAIAIADQLGLDLHKAAQALSTFRGSERRFDIRGEFSGITLVDDYAHHPTEIKATLRAARDKYPHKRIWAVWQPHTYTRTTLLFDRFAEAFSDADQVIVTRVFAAREKEPPGFSEQNLVDAIENPRAVFIPELEDVEDYLVKNLTEGDVVIVLTAGDAIRVNERLEKIFSAQEE